MSGDELLRYSRIQRIFETLEKQGMDGQQVIKDILTVDPEEILKNKRAMDLMKEWLSEKEMKDFVKTGEIVIPSRLYPERGRVYKISRGRHDLTHVWENGEHTQDLCVHAANNRELPYGDSILTKIIALKSDESYYLANSNARQIRTSTYDGGGVGGLTVRAASGGHDQVFAEPVNHGGGIYLQSYSVMPAMSESRARLVARKNGTRMDMVGLISTPPLPNSMSKDVVQTCMRYVIAQAMIDDVASTEEGVVVRGLMPELDLRAIGEFQQDVECRSSWRQPKDGVYHVNNEQVNVYEINLNARNDRKVYIIYGLMSLIPSEFNPVSYIEFIRGHVRIIDRIDVSHLNQVDCIQFQTPIMFKRNDDATIRFGLNDEAKGKFSRIKILGCVAEALGTHVTG